jgi:hypothetical protein
MYQLNDIHVRLEHVTIVGAVQPTKGRPAEFGFHVLLGNHDHQTSYPNLESAQAAHDELLTALGIVAK